MPKWRHNIDVSAWWRDTSVSIEEKGRMLARILRRKILPHYPNDLDLPDIIDDFESISPLELEGSEVISLTEEFDACLACLYDWADRDHRLWINTMR